MCKAVNYIWLNIVISEKFEHVQLCLTIIRAYYKCVVDNFTWSCTNISGKTILHNRKMSPWKQDLFTFS